MRRGTLLTQVLLVNLLLIAAAVIAASIASNPENSLRDSASIGLVLGFALAATVAVNIWLLSRRFEPLQRLVAEMQTADLSKPPEPPAVTEGPVEVDTTEPIELVVDDFVIRLPPTFEPVTLTRLLDVLEARR